MDICGLNSPLPHNSCKFGYHPGGWGYPSVDAFGNPVYGGNPFDEPCIPRKEANLFAARIQSLAKTFLIRCRFLRKRRAASRIAALGRGIVARRRYFKARIWVIVIQAYSRRFMERQRYLKKLENIITVQSCARRFLIVNSEDLKKARAAKSERKQLAQDAARMSVRKFMKRFRKKQDKERKERVNKEAPGVEEEDGSLLVEDTLLCQTLDASHFCMEDSVLTVILDNDNYCLDENAFCRVLDAVENPEDEIESETSDQGVPGRGKKAKGFKEDEEIIENGFCYEDSVFSRFFENDVDTVVCGVIDKWEGKNTAQASKDSARIIDKQKASTVLDQVDEIKDDEARNESGRLVEEPQAGTDENLKVEVVETVVESINNQTKASLMDGVSMSSDHSAGPALKLISEHDVVPDADASTEFTAIEDEQNPGVVTTITSDAFQPAEATVEAPAEAVQTLENCQGEAPTSDPTTTEDNEIKTLPAGQISADGKETETDSSVVKQTHSLPPTVEGDNGIDSYAADVLSAAAQALTLSNSEVFDTFPSNSVAMPDPHKAAVISVSAAASVAAVNALAAQRVLSAASVAIPDASAVATPTSLLSKAMGGKTDPDGEKAFTEAAQMSSSLLNSNGFLKGIKPLDYSPFLATNEGLVSEQADMKVNGAAERLRKQMESLTAVRAEIDEMLRVSGRVVYKNPFIPTAVYPSPTTVQAIYFAPTASYNLKVTPQSPPDNNESPTAEETLASTPTGDQENDFVTQGTGEEKKAVSESDKLVESILDSCRQQAAEAARFPRAPYVDSSVGSSARSLQFLVHQKHEQISKQRGGASASSDTGTNSTPGEQFTACRETVASAENSGLTASANGAFKPHTSVVPLVIHEMKDQTFTQDIPPALPRLQDGINPLVEPLLKEMKVDMMSQHSDSAAPMLPSKNMYKSRASYLLALAAAKKQSGMSGPAQTRIST